MNDKKNSVTYYFFYLLFSEDTWRVMAGFIFAVFTGPKIAMQRQLGTGGEIMLWLMLLVIGWWLAAWPAKKIAGGLRAAIKRTG